MSSVLAYFIALPGAIDFNVLTLLTFGGVLVASAANALNQVIEKDFDKLMTRTMNRPIAAGRMNMSTGVIIAGVMLVGGSTLLAMINPLTGFLGIVTVVSYAFIYTPLKRLSTVAVSVGAVPGAMPVLIGCVAAQGELTTLALILFALQFLWQFPHFWSIAYLSFDDYERAGYSFLPVKDGQLDEKLGLYAFLYSVLLILLIVPMVMFSVLAGWLIIPMLLVTLHYVYYAYKFYQNSNRPTALKLMFSSFIYLPASLLIMLIYVL